MRGPDDSSRSCNSKTRKKWERIDSGQPINRLIRKSMIIILQRREQRVRKNRKGGGVDFSAVVELINDTRRTTVTRNNEWEQREKKGEKREKRWSSKFYLVTRANQWCSYYSNRKEEWATYQFDNVIRTEGKMKKKDNGRKSVDRKIDFSALHELKNDAQATVTEKGNQKQKKSIEQ